MALTFTKGYLASAQRDTYADGGFGSTFTPKGSWTSTTGHVKRSFQTYRDIQSPTAQSVPGGGTNPTSKLIAMFVSEPLAAATYSGNLDVIIGAKEVDISDENFWAIHVWVTQGNTNNVRATLLSNYLESSTNEFPVTAAGLALQSAQALSGTWQDGDRLVVEIGFIQRSTTGDQGTIYVRNNFSLSDLTVGSTSVTTLNGFVSFSSPITLAAPDHNLVDNAKVVSSLPYNDTFKNQYCQGESGTGGDQYLPYGNNFDIICGPGWYKWVATYTGSLYLSCTGSVAGHPRVGIWENYTAAQLKTSAADNNAIAWGLSPTDVSPVVASVVSGRTYYIQVGADFSFDFPVQYGDITVKLTSTAPGAAPANDDCANAEAITPGWTGSATTTGATSEAGDPQIDGVAVGKTIWYKFTPTENGSGVFARTTDYTSRIGVFTGSCGAFSQVASVGAGTTGAVQWTTIAGTTYYIMVGAPASDGGSFAGVFHHLVAFVNFSADNSNPATPDRIIASGSFPANSDAGFWTLEYQKVGDTTWTLWNGTTIANSPAGTTLADVFPGGAEITGLCGNTNYFVRMTPHVNISSVTYDGPEVDDSVLTNVSRAIYFPNGSMIRTWPMLQEGRTVPTHYSDPLPHPPEWYVVTADDPPLAYMEFNGNLNALVWAKLDGLGGNVTFYTNRSVTADNTGGPNVVAPLNYANQSYRWFGVRDYKLTVDICGDNRYDANPANRTRAQKVFTSTFTLQPGICYHCAYALTQTGGTLSSGFTWLLKMWVNGAVVHSEAWAPGPFTNPSTYTTSTETTSPVLKWFSYGSIGGMQNEDGTPSDYFTSDGGVSLSRLRSSEDPAVVTDSYVLAEYNSCETPIHAGSPKDQVGLYGIGSPLSAFLPTYPDQSLYGEGVTLIGGATSVRSCCSCETLRAFLGPIYWLRWNRQVLP